MVRPKPPLTKHACSRRMLSFLFHGVAVQPHPSPAPRAVPMPPSGSLPNLTRDSDSLNSRQEPIMSWQQYVDTYLIGSGKCAEGAIISAGGDGGIWARSPGLRVTPDEVSKLLRAFVDPGDAATSGIRVGGRKYMFLRSDGDAVYAKERDDGLVAMRTRTALVLALYSKGTVPGECATAVGRVADYLRQHGY